MADLKERAIQVLLPTGLTSVIKNYSEKEIISFIKCAIGGDINTFEEMKEVMKTSQFGELLNILDYDSQEELFYIYCEAVGLKQ